MQYQEIKLGIVVVYSRVRKFMGNNIPKMKEFYTDYL